MRRGEVSFRICICVVDLALHDTTRSTAAFVTSVLTSYSSFCSQSVLFVVVMTMKSKRDLLSQEMSDLSLLAHVIGVCWFGLGLGF